MEIQHRRDDLLTTVGTLCLLGVIILVVGAVGIILAYHAHWSTWGVLLMMGLCYVIGRLHSMLIADRKALKLYAEALPPIDPAER